MVKESPSTQVDSSLRQRVGHHVVQALMKLGYTNAGTVEFLMDEDRQLYFMEMNTRIQVEHPVTEMVTGIDLVKLQIQVAAGQPLTLASGLQPRGHAIECRINAEHPDTFVPSPGKLKTFHPPGGPRPRLDTHAYEDYVIPPYYDSLVAKLIVHDRTRAEALARMSRALDFFVVEGIHTSIPLHKRILRDPEFMAGRMSTRFLEGFLRRQAQAG